MPDQKPPEPLAAPIRSILGEPTHRNCAKCGSPAFGVAGALCPTCRAAANAADFDRELRRVVAEVRAQLPERFRGFALGGAGREALWGAMLGPAEGRDKDRPAIARKAIEAALASVGLGAVENETRFANAAPPTSCLIQGDAGRGKTSLAAALLVGHAVRLVGPRSQAGEPGSGWNWDAARSCSYVRALTLPDAKVWEDGARIDGADLRRARAARALVVDDLGLEPVSPTTIELLHDRADRELATIVTTSLSVAELKAVYGDGTARRLCEDSYTIALNAGGLR